MTVTPVGRREASKRHRQDLIEKAASMLLLTKTFDEITTKEVAAEAGIGEATLFRYITGKQELLTLVYGDRLDDVLNETEEADARSHMLREQFMGADYFVQRVLQVYRMRCDFYLLNPSNAARYLREGFDAASPQAARHLAQGDRTIRLVTTILREGQSEAVIRNDVDMSLVAQNCHGTYMHEIDRSPVRKLDPATIWDRLEPRLRVQLVPLGVESAQMEIRHSSRGRAI